MSPPRIVVLGFSIECNRFAPLATRADFLARGWYEGAALEAEARRAAPAIMAEIPAFFRRMDETGPWTPVPLLATHAEPNGPVEHGFFRTVLGEFRERLAAALPVDGVYVCAHGAAITTEDHDPDGTLFALVREMVGPAVPLVATLDLHANVSTAMVDAVDTLVVYRRNPHTDMAERGAEAADVMRALLAGAPAVTAQVRLPIVAPQVTLLTAPGAGPYADLMAHAESRRDPRLLNVSVVGGFSYGDTPKNGLTVLVTTRGVAHLAGALALEIAERGWADRDRYRPRLTPLEDAVAAAVAAGRDPGLPAVCLADVADNPGGGGRGNTTELLAALHRAGTAGVLMGLFHDPALAAEAHARGEGARFEAVFNRAVSDPFAHRFAAPAQVLRLSDGAGIGRRGMMAGRSYTLGRSAALLLDGITVVVASDRRQCLEPAYFEMFGLDIGRARAAVVKSRGHFRAGFDEFFRPERILEVDAPGLTSPVLSRFQFRHLPRPVVPLDDDVAWTPALHLRYRAPV